MNKFICSAVSSVLCTLVLTGCSLPGLNNDDDDNFFSTSYSDNALEEKKSAYSWLIEPSVSADNIITFDGSQVNPDAETNSSYSRYSVIRNNGKYGLIDYSGNIVISAEYDNYYTCSCGEVILYNVIDEKNKQYEYCTVDSTNQVVNYTARHEDKSPEYFWNDKKQKIYVKKKNEDFGTEYTGKKTVVAGKAEIKENSNGTYDITPEQNSFYGLVKKNQIILEMEYSDYYAPAYKGAGLTCIALKDSSGKWGYVGSDGKIIIDFKCDADINSYGGMLIDDDTVTHPYLFTGDYVPVLINASYGYYDIDGNCVVNPGEFEQARPVHNGKAWVRKNGLWGVIQLGEIVEEEPLETSKSTTTTTTYYYTSTTKTTTTASSFNTSSAKTTVNTISEPTQTTSAPTQAATEAPPDTEPIVSSADTEPTPPPEPPVPETEADE